MFLSIHLQWVKQVPQLTPYAFVEQELRLVNNLTKLKPVSNVAQQVLAFWLVAFMLNLPIGNSKGHKGSHGQLLETVVEPTTHHWALWGGGTRAQ